jgi:hypothetical protein
VAPIPLPLGPSLSTTRGPLPLLLLRQRRCPLPFHCARTSPSPSPVAMGLALPLLDAAVVAWADAARHRASWIKGAWVDSVATHPLQPDLVVARPLHRIRLRAFDLHPSVSESLIRGGWASDLAVGVAESPNLMPSQEYSSFIRH